MCVIDRVIVSFNVAVSMILLHSHCECKSCVCIGSCVSVSQRNNDNVSDIVEDTL